MSYWYLATPYDAHPEGRERAFADACEQAGMLLSVGIQVFSPIAHTHPIARRCDLPGDFEFWRRYDAAMIGASMGLIVCTLPGWEASKGIDAETDIATSLGKPTLHMEPGKLPSLRGRP